MKVINVLSLFLACFLVVITPTAAAKKFNTLALLDSHGDNFLFRGGDTAPTGVFLYDDLVAEMKQITALPADFKMVVFNFMFDNINTEAATTAAEFAYWAANPTKGYTVHIPITGASTSPYSFSEEYVQQHSGDLSVIGDDLITLLAEVRTILLSTTGGPKVIFVHCTCGCDRTGEFSSVYAMRYLGKTLAQTRNTNVAIIGREMATSNLHGTAWYCFNLKYNYGFSDLTCVMKGPGDVVLPECLVSVTQTKTALWPNGNDYKSQWSVTIKNNNLTADEPSLFLYAISYSSAPSNAAKVTSSWGYSIKPNNYVLPPAYQPGLGAGQSITWGYEIKGVDPVELLVVNPSICVTNFPAPAALAQSCKLSVSQTASSPYQTDGVDYAYVEGRIINADPVNSAYYVNITLAGSHVGLWGLTQVGPNLYTMQTYSSGIAPNSAFYFGYTAVGSSSPLPAAVVKPLPC